MTIESRNEKLDPVIEQQKDTKETQNQAVDNYYETEFTDLPTTEHQFQKSFNFRHSSSVKDLRRQALCIRVIVQSVREKQQKVISTYRVDLFTLAIGPVQHAIELMRGEHQLFGLTQHQKYVGLLSANIHFTQTQKVEIQLTDLKAQIFEKQLSHSYQASFRVVTFNAVGESTKSYMVRSKAQKQRLTRLKSSELKHGKKAKEKRISNLDWKFQGVESQSEELGFEMAGNQRYHLDEPDAFENPRIEESFDIKHVEDISKSPPYIVVSPFFE